MLRTSCVVVTEHAELESFAVVLPAGVTLVSGGENSWSTFRLSEDLDQLAVTAVVILVVASVVLLTFETYKRQNRGLWVWLTGLMAALSLAGAVLRPTRLVHQGKRVAGSVLALVDSSHRMDLPEGGTTRRRLAEETLARLKDQLHDARVQVAYFDEDVLPATQKEQRLRATSDLIAALSHSESSQSELPQSIVLLSDGRLTRPGPMLSGDASASGSAGKVKRQWQEALQGAAAGIPIHTVDFVGPAPRDRSLRSVGLTGTAVAHQPFRLEIEVGCEPAADCDEVDVVVKELLEGQPGVELSRGHAQGQGGLAKLSLEVTLEQAGSRALSIELEGDSQDAIPQNDRRIMPVFVRRDRLRLLHVAGRPTYDVRALRMFLKSDESIDLISFFILRTHNDQVQAEQEELSLIPFPVDELFSEHLRSFDAVILQDINAPLYRLDRHFRSIKDYVLKGGGLILVGGPTGFSSGGYAGSPVADVLPVVLPRQGELIERRPFVPAYTDVGRAAPVLRALRATMGEELPRMSGANILGTAKDNALVLWEHPELDAEAAMAVGRAASPKMPVLAVGEVGDGRSIAISVDGTHQLRFGEAGARTGGRAYADLWEGLLGWLMRDPRFESAQMRLEGECVAGTDQIILVDPLPGAGDAVTVTLERLGTTQTQQRTLQKLDTAPDGALRFVARQIPEGGYAVRVRVGAAPPTRTVIACEQGGEAWADSRPDHERLRAIAAATSGRYVPADALEDLPEPRATFISSSKQSLPLLPAWIWALAATALMCVHWIVRRAVGHV